MPDKNNSPKAKPQNPRILVNTYDKVAEAARILYIYGCFSNVDFDNPDIRNKINKSLINSNAGYRSRCVPLVTILEDLVKNCRYKTSKSDKGKKQLFISPDRFDDEVTGLVNVYRLKAAKSMENPIADYINYTYRLAYPEAQKLEIKNKRELAEYFGYDVNKDSLFMLRKGNANFTDEELSQLYTALMFFNGKAPYSVPGFFSCDRINDYLKMSGKDTASDNANVIFNYNNIDRILNDNAVYSIFSAIKDKKPITFYYRELELKELRKLPESEKSSNNDSFISEKSYCYPLKVMYEFQNGRGYLIAWSYTRRCIRIYRIDDIFRVKPIDADDTEMLIDESQYSEIERAYRDFIKQMWLSHSNANKMNITIDFDVKAEVIMEQIPLGIVTPLSENTCRLEVENINYKDIVPFVRRFGEKAHISKEKSKDFYKYIKDDLEVALKNYGAL